MCVCVCVCISRFHTHCENFFSTFDLLSLSVVEARRETSEPKTKKPFTSATAYHSYLARRASYSRAEVFLNQKFTWLQQLFLLNTIFQSRSFLGCNSSCFQTSYSKAVLLIVATIASKHHIPSRYYLGCNNKLLPSIIELLCCNNKSLLSIIIQSRSFLCCNNKLLTIHFCCISGSCKKRDDEEKGSGEFLVAALHLKLFIPHAYLQFQGVLSAAASNIWRREANLIIFSCSLHYCTRKRDQQL